MVAVREVVTRVAPVVALLQVTVPLQPEAISVVVLP